MRQRAARRRPPPGARRTALAALATLFGLLAPAACGPDAPGPEAAAPADASRPLEPEAAAPPRHVVLVVVESLRADHVGAYGYDRPTTPHLDALAADGLLFGRAYAGSSSAPQSLSALWSGRLPSSGGSTGLREATPHPSVRTLPRMFARAGFHTGLAGNHVGLRERPFTRGFDEIELDSVPNRWTAGRVTEKALDIVDAFDAGAPFFLVVDYADAGEPHVPLEEHRARFDVPLPAPQELISLGDLRRGAGDLPEDIEEQPGFLDLVARYDAEIAHVDDALGALVDGLAARDLLDDALLVVTASHGVEFLEHEYVGHGWTLHEELIRVPLVLRSPRLATRGRLDEPVSLVDLAPTLAAVFELGDREHLFDGEVLLEPGRDGLVAKRTSGRVIAELVVPELTIQRATIRADWKLVETLVAAAPADRAARLAAYDDIVRSMADGEQQRPDPFGPPVRRELFDLDVDPYGTVDLAASYPERVEALSGFLQRFVDYCRENGLGSRAAPRPMELPDASAVEALQQLGYL